MMFERADFAGCVVSQSLERPAVRCRAWLGQSLFLLESLRFFTGDYLQYRG